MTNTPAVSRRSICLSFAGLCVVNYIAAVDSTALSVALPTIATSLHATSIQAYWTGTSFLLSSAVCQPVFAATSNALGRKFIVLLTLTLFTVGTSVCRVSHAIAPMLVGRVIQGAGGGGLLALTYCLIADLLPLRQRSIGMSVIAFMWLLGLNTGPIIGGGFSENVSWVSEDLPGLATTNVWQRWIFWFALPFAAVAYLLVIYFLETPYKVFEPWRGVKTVDWIGSTLFVGSLSTFLVGLSWVRIRLEYLLIIFADQPRLEYNINGHHTTSSFR
jgi:MFS family permease